MQTGIAIGKIVTVVLVVLQILLPQISRSRAAKEYRSKEGRRVLVADFAKPESTIESKIEFYTADNRILCALDYSSEDGEHGFGVVKAAWTPDQKYFVFSLTSSGGHQAWHTPTLFYNLRDNSIYSLDSYVDAGISKGDFSLKDPNVVLTEVWRNQRPTPIKFRLDSLGRHQLRNALRCADGKTIRAEPYSLQPDA
jgi:hypothetical protein